MRVAVLFGLFAASCVDASGPPVADLASVDGSALETVTCAQSLADYCAQQDCVSNLATAVTSKAWCGDMGGRFATYRTCDGVVLVKVSGVDSGTIYAYDAATGELQAVLWFANTQGGCLAGPTELELQGCRGETLICPTSS